MNNRKEVEIDPETLQVKIDGIYFGYIFFDADGFSSWQTPEGDRGVDIDRVSLSRLSGLMAQIEADRE